MAKALAVLVLAGGAGRKMVPFTLTTPKAMLPLATRPMLEHLLADLARLGFADVTVAGPADLPDRYRAAGGAEPRGLSLRFTEAQGSPLETLRAGWADAGEALLVVPADVVLGRPEVYRKVAAALKATGATVVSLRGQTATVDVNPGPWVDTGVMALAPAAAGLLAGGGEPGDLPARAGKSAAALDLVKRAPLIGTNTFKEEWLAPCHSGWVDVDRPADLLDAHYVVLARMVAGLKRSRIAKSARVASTVERQGPVVIGPGAKLAHHVRLGSHVWIGAGATLDRCASVGSYSMVGPGGRVDACGKFYGVMGAGSQVGRAAEFGGMLMEKVGFPHASHLAGIVGNRCSISVGIVCGTNKLVDPPFRMYVQGRVEPTHLSGVAIGDGCFIAAGAQLMGGTKIGPYSVVGPGVTVYRDVPPNQFVVRKEEVAYRPVHADKPVEYKEGDYGPPWTHWP